MTSSTTPHTLSSPSYSTEGSPSPPTGSSLLKSGMEGLWVVLRALDGLLMDRQWAGVVISDPWGVILQILLHWQVSTPTFLVSPGSC